MTEKYVALQTQLYGLQPNLNISEHQTIVNSQTQSRSNAGEDVRSQVARLERKLEHLKADILFDKSDAEHHWAGTRNQLAKAAAERRRLHLDENTGSGTSSPRRHENAVAATVQDGQSSDGSNDDDAAEALGDFFSGLPDGPSDSPSAMSVANSTAKVRDFGRWTGVSPRRTLEEACKSRYILRLPIENHSRLTVNQGIPMFVSRTNSSTGHPSRNSTLSLFAGPAISLILLHHLRKLSRVWQIGVVQRSRCEMRRLRTQRNLKHTSQLSFFS